MTKSKKTKNTKNKKTKGVDEAVRRIEAECVQLKNTLTQKSQTKKDVILDKISDIAAEVTALVSDKKIIPTQEEQKISESSLAQRIQKKQKSM